MTRVITPGLLYEDLVKWMCSDLVISPRNKVHSRCQRINLGRQISSVLGPQLHSCSPLFPGFFYRPFGSRCYGSERTAGSHDPWAGWSDWLEFPSPLGLPSLNHSKNISPLSEKYPRSNTDNEGEELLKKNLHKRWFAVAFRYRELQLHRIHIG